jgi:XTP/dITP diphosphohydrolase
MESLYDGIITAMMTKMTKKLIVATGNLHKLQEIKDILGDGFKLFSLQDVACFEDILETESSLEGNALLKAQYIYQKYGLDCFSDDTGLEVYALNYAPGVYSARYAGKAKDLKANVYKVLKELEGKNDYSARFRTVVALIFRKEKYFFEGIVEGTITKEERGTAGFDYDSIFIPQGYTQTFAELGEKIKNTISHRALALNKLRKFLNEK